MDNSLESPKRGSKNVFSYVGIIVSLLVIIVIVLLNNNGAIQKLLQPNSTPVQQKVAKPTPNPLATPPTISKALTFQGCDIKKEGNPLVEGVRTSNGDIIGTFYGNINNIKKETGATTSAMIDIISPKGEQTYNFNSKDEAGLVYDGTTQKNLKLSDLSQGKTIVATFNCFPKQNNLFKITKVTVVGN